MVKLRIVFIVCLLPGITSIHAQLGAQLEKALREERYHYADSLLTAAIQGFVTAKRPDSIIAYALYTGRIEEKLSNSVNAEKRVNALFEIAKTFPLSTAQQAKLQSERAEYFGSIGKYEQAYHYKQQALQLLQTVSNVDPAIIASLHSEMGTFANRKGDVSLSMQHHRKAITGFMHASAPDQESLYVAANNMGTQMWLVSRMDSALYFFNIALTALSKTKNTPINRYYRPAVLQNNMSALYNMQGETKKGIQAMKDCIENLRIYLSIPETTPKKSNTISFQHEAIDNLGGIYKELGDYSQALSLLKYSYGQKLKPSNDDPAGVHKSEILLGQLYLSMKEYQQSLQFLQKGLEGLLKQDGDYLFWQADACGSLAYIYEYRQDNKKAAFYFQQADSLYETSLQGEYDDIYLEFLRNSTLFYAKNDQFALALTLANKGFNYIKKTQGVETLLAFYQLLNLAELYLQAGKYAQSLQYSKQGLAIVDKKIRNSESLLDSVKIELRKPKAILLKVKALYNLQSTKTIPQLTELIKELNDALAIIERRKLVVPDVKDISVMMADHGELLDFIKKITLDLYHLSNNKAYIDDLLNLQESGTYYRIRSRLDKTDSIRFAHVPAVIQQQEKKLKAAVHEALNAKESSSKGMSNYFSAVNEWERFMTSLKKDYPSYFKMRYGSIFTSVPDVQQAIPAGSTLVRYMFIDRELFALVMDRQQRQWVPLQHNDLEEGVKRVSDYATPVTDVGNTLYQLHQQLWAPLTPYIKNKKIIIIPDGILFNLNFEMLTPEKIRQYDELATNSLLAHYTISYHYTTSLLGQREQTLQPTGDFVAFAPGFLDQGKGKYVASVKDSLQLDRVYMTLLPQPFTVDFVAKTNSLLGGTAYVNEASTAHAFKTAAGNHKIIHIGTHAESNNLLPEFSRLIFTKAEADESNSVYLHEIYNCDLRSALAVLTACESGKPGYQDGEGMISLAHAFNYAGSQSMVTGLWMIDEKASTMLMEAFYQYLLKGMDKDEALRQAKLHYLKSAKGRMLAPAYWAGIVLMGDTSPVEIRKQGTAKWWIIGGVLVVLGLGGIWWWRGRQL